MSPSTGIPGPFRWGVLYGAIILAGGLADTRKAAGGDAATAPLTAAQQAQLKERDRWSAEFQKCLREGAFPQAMADLEKDLAIESEVLGEASADALGSMHALAWLNALVEDFAAARRWSQRALEIQQRNHPLDSWAVRDAQRTLADVQRLSAMGPEQRQRLREAEQLNAQVKHLTDVGNYKVAIPLAEKAQGIRQQILGQEHPDYLTGLSNLGSMYRFQGDFDKAEPLLRQALDGRRKALGEEHPLMATSNNGLGWLHVNRQAYAEAEACFRRAAEVSRRAEGEFGLTYALSLDNLAEVFVLTKHYRRAEALRLDVLQIRKRVQGEQHTDYARGLYRLASVYDYLHEYDKGAPLYRQALEIFQRNLGQKDANYLSCLRSLAGCYQQSGKLAQALAIELQALEVQKQIWGPEHANVGISLHWVGAIYLAMKDHAKALEFERQALDVFRKSRGEQDDQYATSLGNVAWLLDVVSNDAQQREDFPAARRARAEEIEILSKLYGPQHWKVADSRRIIAFVEQLSKMNAAERGRLAEADGLWNKAEAAVASRSAAGIPPAEEALEIRRAILGEEHWLTLKSLFQVGFLYKAAGDFAKAEPIYVRLPELTRRIRGELDPDYAVSLHNLARLYEDKGDFTQAETLYTQALEARRKVFGEQSTEFANTLNSLASVHQAMGRLGKAEALYRRALQIRREVLGAQDPDYALSLHQLGWFYLVKLADTVKAGPLLQQAVEIYKAALGQEHPRYARSLGTLAIYYDRCQQYERAEALYQQALAICRKALGDQHPDCAVPLGNLAIFYSERGDYDRAEPYAREALAIEQRVRGENSPQVAHELNTLVWLYKKAGKYAQAEPLARQAVQICKDTLGARHHEYAANLSELGLLYGGLQAPARGVPLALEALRLARDHLEQNAASQSEQQQLAMRKQVWRFVDNYLYLTALAHVPAEDVYAEVLNWKGVVGARQQQIRRLHHRLKQSGNQEVVALETELENATGRLAALTRSGSYLGKERQFRLAELSDAIERLQQRLANASVEFREQRAQLRRTPGDLRKALPPDAALVDLVVYSHCEPSKEKGQPATWPKTLTAFILSGDRPVERVALGPVEPIEQAIAGWRKRFGGRLAETDPGRELRELLWLPLEKHFAHAKVVLISPESVTAPLPWAVLPGKGPGTYLIDEIAVAIVPIPGLLPELLDEGTPATLPASPSLLLVGDVDFGADPGKSSLLAASRSAARGDAAMAWQPLPGTREEVAAIAASFRQGFAGVVPAELTRDRATKDAVRRQAAQYQYLHFSTHGFFAPPQVRSAEATASERGEAAAIAGREVSGYHPGLLSGLVLAGANQPVAEGQEDGILTALEVEELDLSRVQLATLSACETGLGETAGGEGLLGLQRAFQTAGAKTVVAGLWQIPDKATQVLMARFYDNLWQKHMTKLQALREAQQWLSREGPQQRDLLRGLQRLPDGQTPSAETDRLPPYYWGAFVLSGDWR